MDPTEKLLLRVSFLSVVSGIIHGIVTPDHFEEWWGYGLFFLTASFAQSIYGAVPLFSRLVEGVSITETWRAGSVRAYYWAGILGNASIILLWVVTRTVGIPFFGPEAGEVEAVRFLDATSKVLEVAIIVGLVILLRRRR